MGILQPAEGGKSGVIVIRWTKGIRHAFTRGSRIIRAEIERLEKALKESTDGGIRERIKVWIEEEKKKLLSADSSK